MPRAFLVGVGSELAARLRSEATLSPIRLEQTRAPAADDLADPPEAVVLGPSVEDPLGVARAIHIADRDIAVLIASPPERRQAVERALRFAPSIGRDVRLYDSHDTATLAAALAAGVDRVGLRRRHRANLAASTQRLRAARQPPAPTAQYLGRLLEHAPIGTLLLDGERRVVGWNRLARDLFGMGPGLLGTCLDDLFGDEGPAAVARLLRSGSTRVSLTLPHTGEPGASRQLEATASPLEPTGEGGWLVLLNDVTEEVRLLASERAAREEAEAAVQARDAFLSIASHELKTPIAALRGFADLSLRRMERAEGLSPAEARRAFSTIRAEADRLGRMVALLLDVSRLERDVLPVELARIDFADLVEEVVALFRARGDAPVLVLDSPREAWVEADAVRLHQVLFNLLDNVAKYGRSDRAAEVTLRILQEHVRLTVRDYGAGVPPAERGHLFERYFRGHAQTHQSGMGLGLHVSRVIVERHGGELRAEFPADGGTAFIVTLPRGA